MNGKEEMTVKKILKHFCIILAVVFLALTCVRTVQADADYKIIINDGEDLLSLEEENKLKEKMAAITEYGNVAFVSVAQYGYTDDYAKSIYRSYFGTDSGFLFLIDMGQRNIWIFSDGAIYRVINKAYANTITDNVYRYASRGEYYECAWNVYDQAQTLLEGGKIAQPMKYISNVFIALVTALLINFAFLLFQRRKESVDYGVAAAAMTGVVGVSVLEKKMTRRKKSVHVDSDSGGYSGGGGSSGGGGGGGSSGGGGGHSF